MILNTLVYDGKVERILAGDGSNLYRAIQPLVTSPGLIRTPCGVCPVRRFTNILYLLYNLLYTPLSKSISSDSVFFSR